MAKDESKKSNEMPSEKKTRQGFILPHILFAKLAAAYKDNQFEQVETFFELPLDGGHCYEEKVRYYLGKGFKIVRYHFPENAEERALWNNPMNFNGYTTILGADGNDLEDRFFDVKSLVKNVTEGDSEVRRLKEEIENLKKSKSEPLNKPNVKGAE